MTRGDSQRRGQGGSSRDEVVAIFCFVTAGPVPCRLACSGSSLVPLASRGSGSPKGPQGKSGRSLSCPLLDGQAGLTHTRIRWPLAMSPGTYDRYTGALFSVGSSSVGTNTCCCTVYTGIVVSVTDPERLRAHPPEVSPRCLKITPVAAWPHWSALLSPTWLPVSHTPCSEALGL